MQLTEKSRLILEAIAKGHTYEQILVQDLAWTYHDIFQAAAEALHQAAPAPYPAALAGHPFVSQVTPAAMASTRWDEPRNAPGGCQANPREVRRNAHGYAELDTTDDENYKLSSSPAPQGHHPPSHRESLAIVR